MPSSLRYYTSILLVAVLALSTLGDAVVSLCLPSNASTHGCKSGTCCCKTKDGSVAACCAQKGGKGICFSVAGCSNELLTSFQALQKDDAVINIVFAVQDNIPQDGKTSLVIISHSFEIPVDLFHPPPQA